MVKELKPKHGSSKLNRSEQEATNESSNQQVNEPVQQTDSNSNQSGQQANASQGSESTAVQNNASSGPAITEDPTTWAADRIEDLAKGDLKLNRQAVKQSNQDNQDESTETDESDDDEDVDDESTDENESVSNDEPESVSNDSSESEDDESDEEEDIDKPTVVERVKSFAKGALGKGSDAIGAGAKKTIGAGLSMLTGTGLSTAAASVVMASAAIFALGAVGMAGAAVVASNNVKVDTTVAVDDCTSEKKAAKSASEVGEVDSFTTEAQMENAKKIHSVLSADGLTDIQISGVIGNGMQESSLNPKKFEADFVNNGSYRTEENYNRVRTDGPLVESIFGTWSKFYGYYGGGLNEDGYKAGAPDGKHTIGIGVWQWTGGGSMGLWNFDKDGHGNMWEMDTQLVYMLSSVDGDASYHKRYETYKSMNSSNPEQAAVDFLNRWEYAAGNFTMNDGTHAHAENRAKYAAEWYVKLKEMKVDKSYANSVLEKVVNATASASKNKVESTKKAKAKCEEKSTESYGGSGWQKKGGVYSGNNGSWQAWKYDALPGELKQYAIDPRSLGMKFGSSEGWTGASAYISSGICNQCTTLSAALIGVLWEKDGKPILARHGMSGNGKDLVGQMASALGVKVRKEPVSGDVFSFGSNGNHTGVVSHVFENGDILIVEQNVSGISGASLTGDALSLGANNFQWGYQYVTKSTYGATGYTFASPESAGYTISSKAKSVG